jgi:hypothetical protein
VTDAAITESKQAGQDPATASVPPAPQLPLVDLIGLRFSLQHLRLVGYGLLAVWLAEIVNLLTSPGLADIGNRLYWISQFLDLSPILLVAIGLIAFQGGLRRSAGEQVLLPLLLTLLPLLSTFHFFLTPVSIANAVTLLHKQQQIGSEQIERVETQFSRASAILLDSDSIDALLNGLQRIPGLQVRVPNDASVVEARREVRSSLERERDRLRDRIRKNLSTSRDAFLRRAITNATLALVVGLLLWGLHQGAVREMEQAIPFLDWVLTHGQVNQSPEMVQQLLRFQRACMTLGWFALLMRLIRVVRRVVGPGSQEEKELEEDRSIGSLEDVSGTSSPPVYPAPPRRSSILGGYRPLFPAGLPPLGEGLLSSDPGGEDPEAEPFTPEELRELEAREQKREARERRRRERDLRRGRAALRRMADSDMVQELREIEVREQKLDASERRRREIDLMRGRAALRRMADSDMVQVLQGNGQDKGLPWGIEMPPPRSGPLRRLWRWFFTHL